MQVLKIKADPKDDKRQLNVAPIALLVVATLWMLCHYKMPQSIYEAMKIGPCCITIKYSFQYLKQF